MESLEHNLQGTTANRVGTAQKACSGVWPPPGRWAIMLVIRMKLWATRMIIPIILNHPRRRQQPVDRPSLHDVLANVAKVSLRINVPAQ